MHMTDLIEKKKQGQTLTQEELHFIVHGYTAGDIPDYQMSALMMAIYFRGMTPEETAQLTIEMEHSGDVVDLSPLGEHTADKHSTGGVGDKTSLVLCPMVAACWAIKTGCPRIGVCRPSLGITAGARRVRTKSAA